MASEPNNANAWNLPCYALRTIGKFVQSADAYNKALDIEPDHKNPLEYQGEQLLLLGNRAGAEANLAKLETRCPYGCEQLERLKNAIRAN